MMSKSEQLNRQLAAVTKERDDLTLDNQELAEEVASQAKVSGVALHTTVLPGWCEWHLHNPLSPSPFNPTTEVCDPKHVCSVTVCA